MNWTCPRCNSPKIEHVDRESDYLRWCWSCRFMWTISIEIKPYEPEDLELRLFK